MELEQSMIAEVREMARQAARSVKRVPGLADDRLSLAWMMADRYGYINGFSVKEAKRAIFLQTFIESLSVSS